MTQPFKLFAAAVFVFVCSSAFAQQENPLINSGEVLIKAYEFRREEAYDKALLELNKVSEGDTNYYRALLDKSNAYLNTKQYEKGIAACQQGINAANEFCASFHVNLIVIYRESEQYEAALKAADKLIAKFPYYYAGYYHKGYVYKAMKKPAEAIKYYKLALNLNPEDALSHFGLGQVAAEENKPTQALLSYYTAVLVNPGSDRALKILSVIEDYCTKSYEGTPTGVVLSPEGAEDFDELDLILSNKMALSPKYKTNSKVTFNLIKQADVLISKLRQEPGNEGFWSKFYVPLYLNIQKQNLFEPFSYYLVQSTTNEGAAKIVLKNQARVKVFAGWLGKEWYASHCIVKLDVNGEKDKKVKLYFYASGMIEAIAPETSTETDFSGNWIFFHTNAYFSSKGVFNKAGKRTGLWEFYSRESGKLYEKAEFSEGNLDGNYIGLNKWGYNSYQANFVNGKKEGKVTDYYPYGKVMTDENYKNGVKEGQEITFHKNGAHKYECNYTQGKFDKDFKEYSADGKILREITLRNGIKEGVFKLYHKNGVLKEEGIYTADKLNGVNKGYYDNGQLSVVATYKMDILVGPYKRYYEDGVIQSEGTYDEKGKLAGEVKTYTAEGKLYQKQTYVKGDLATHICYTSDGKEIYNTTRKGSTLDYKAFYEDGTLKSEGKIIAGKTEGVWKNYDQNGALASQTTYKKDQLSGPGLYYLPNGKLYKEMNYEADEAEGYYKTFHINEKPAEEGWFQKGKKVGTWYKYFLDGTKSYEAFFIAGKLNGAKKSYSQKGRLNEEWIYDKDMVTGFKGYDSTGTVVFDSNRIENLNGEFVKRFNNKKKSFVGHYTEGDAYGDFIWYNYDGSVSCKGAYFNDQRIGKWVWNDENGKIKTEGFYKYGNKDSVWVDYFPNGKKKEVEFYKDDKLTGAYKLYFETGALHETSTYKNGELEGERIQYGQDGQTVIVRYYKKGKLLSYTYEGADKKLKTPIPVVNETAAVKTFYSNGNVAVEFTIDKGYYVGKYQRFHSNGKLWKDGIYINDELNGVYKEYYPDGTLFLQSNYVYGLPNGRTVKYHPNGKVMSSVNRIYDSLEGNAFYYNEAGVLTKKVTYYSDKVYGIGK